jgi:hypothetical protein
MWCGVSLAPVASLVRGSIVGAARRDLIEHESLVDSVPPALSIELRISIYDTIVCGLDQAEKIA